MASYSKVFKASHLTLMDGVKRISEPLTPLLLYAEDGSALTNLDADEGIETPDAFQLIEDAKAQAQEIIKLAEQSARSREALVTENINRWWEENHKKLETMSAEAKQQGFEDGFTNGTQEAKKQFQQKYQEKIEEVQHLLQQAYEEKEAIIAEAEPFLLELSFAIASQVIHQELESYPDKFVELIKQHILRFKEKEFITVCVHPDDFDFIQSQRAHILAVVNGETEVKIIPDHSVSPKGCIIRTAYGSVDARIDTQIEEIKKVILGVRKVKENGINS